MGLKEAMLLSFATCFLIFNKGVEGTRTTLSEVVQSPNESAMKTITTEAGQVFDCVDIYKQPALDHPSLKNHKIQMKPTSIPKRLETEKSSAKFTSNYSQIGMKSIGCPQGTVPILRYQQNVLKKATIRSRSRSQGSRINVPHSPGYHLTMMAKTKPQENAKYHGSKTYIAVYTPPMLPDQFTEGAMWINNGPPDQLNSIQVGWTVNPTLYGDNRTHLFGYWTADGYKQTGCFDIRCPGFVQISAATSLGLILEPTSHGRVQYEGLFHVFQDSKTGDWWLAILPHDLFVGYWPKYLFTSLASHANQIAWGGEVYSPRDKPAPPMGSGQFNMKDTEVTCYARAIEIIDESYQHRDLRFIEIITDGFSYNHCYAVGYTGFVRYVGYSVLFGGPGGSDCFN
ncbi:putative NEP-interacting protein [Thalictrum thalictroides]|uniref:Putative NEP-interacting protein n=1 Tax=Thalictrum thalictroides TaxID=46969 RepID=A0A7J6WBV7_THATH|nr:putative NEP-interacting protein [Thalictrum thalictroides]